MNRRQLLKLLVTGVAAQVIDPEQLLWTPTKKYFLPGTWGSIERSTYPFWNSKPLQASGIIALEYERVFPKIKALFERDDMFYAQIERRDVTPISTREMRISLQIRPDDSSRVEWDKALILDDVPRKV